MGNKSRSKEKYDRMGGNAEEGNETDEADKKYERKKIEKGKEM